jgi:hypothetical protein
LCARSSGISNFLRHVSEWQPIAINDLYHATLNSVWAFLPHLLLPASLVAGGLQDWKTEVEGAGGALIDIEQNKASVPSPPDARESLSPIHTAARLRSSTSGAVACWPPRALESFPVPYLSLQVISTRSFSIASPAMLPCCSSSPTPAVGGSSPPYSQ